MQTYIWLIIFKNYNDANLIASSVPIMKLKKIMNAKHAKRVIC